MFERHRMIKNSFLRSKDTLWQGQEGLVNECTADAVDRFTNVAIGNKIEDIYLKKMDASTAPMARTEGWRKSSATVVNTLQCYRGGVFRRRNRPTTVFIRYR